MQNPKQRYQALATSPPSRTLNLPSQDALKLFGVFLCAFAVTYFSIQLSPQPGQIAIIWPANAALLVLVLRQTTIRRTALFGTIFLGQLAANTLVAAPLMISATFAAANTIEIYIASRIIGSGEGTYFFQKPGMRKLLIAAIVASAVSATIATMGAFSLTTTIDLVATTLWFAASALGILVFTPVGIAISDLERIKVIFATPGFGLGLILLSIVSAGVFTQSGAPLIYIIPPILIVAATIGGIRGAALAVVALFLTTAPLTLMGYGPIHFTTPDYTQSMLRYQLFLGANTIVALSAGLLTSQRKELMRKLASAEREYRTLVEKSNDITLRYSPGGIISYASRAVKSLGVSSEEVIGQPLTDFMKPVGDSSQSTGEAKFPNVDAKTPQQFKVTCKNGNIIWLEGNPKAIRNKAGQVVEIISTFRNVTERHEREVALAAAKCAAEQAANTKMEFLSNMSHEIRTPMNGVLGMAQVLSETQLSHVQREYVELILDSGGSLLTILNNILDLSKIEADMMSINLCPIDLREIAEIFRNLYKPNAKKKGVLFDVHVHNSVPDSIMADPVRVKQCIENLITNALKFTPQGSVQVVISADKKNYNTHTIKIHVADTGIGMSKQTTHDVFKPFTQADGSSTRIYGGTGLGLPIARKLAKIMGGDLTVISRLDHGSVFVFTFTAPIAADSYSGNIVHIPIIRARSNTRHLPTISHGQ